MGSKDAPVKFYTEVLPNNQLALLKKLGPFMREKRCHLGGGTAIALMLGHRRSVDLDWFTPGSIPDSERLAGELKRYAGNATVSIKDIDIARGTIYATLGGIRISILEYCYPTLRPAVRWPGGGCELASLDDLSCMKLAAVASRGAKKDFVDIYALLEKHTTLKTMFSRYREKYSERNITHIVFSLTYFEDAEPQPLPGMLWNVTWEEMKKRIQEAVKEFSPRGNENRKDVKGRHGNNQ